jgi:hypothetical protein
MFARSIHSSTRAFDSCRLYMATSVGFWVSESSLNRTSGEARVSAPASIRRCRRMRARWLSRLTELLTRSYKQHTHDRRTTS